MISFIAFQLLMRSSPENIKGDPRKRRELGELHEVIVVDDVN